MSSMRLYTPLYVSIRLYTFLCGFLMDVYGWLQMKMIHRGEVV